jgi:hypothetical protein
MSRHGGRLLQRGNILSPSPNDGSYRRAGNVNGQRDGGLTHGGGGFRRDCLKENIVIMTAAIAIAIVDIVDISIVERRSSSSSCSVAFSCCCALLLAVLLVVVEVVVVTRAAFSEGAGATEVILSFFATATWLQLVETTTGFFTTTQRNVL